MFIFSERIDWVAFVWFLTVWVGYTAYALRVREHKDSLGRMLYKFRVDWVSSLFYRENRIADMTMNNGMTNLSGFLASTTILIIAGTLTALSSADELMALISGHAFIAPTTKEQVQFKVLAIILTFVFAFFRLTWSMRQYTFCALLMGTAPLVKDRALTTEEASFATSIARICDRAAREFNYGLRAYYFSLALITWFISPWLFMMSCACVVGILYRREFMSMTLKHLVQGRGHYVRIKGSAA